MDDPTPSHPQHPWIRGTDLTPAELRAALDSGRIVRVRRNLYLPRPDGIEARAFVSEAHRALLDQLRSESINGVVCLESAAVLHGATPLTPHRTVHLVVGWNAGGMKLGEADQPPFDAPGRVDRRRRLAQRAVARHRYPVPQADIVEIRGMRVTSLERTMEDCARFLEPDRGLAVVDSLIAVAVGACASARPWDRREQIDGLAAATRELVLERLDGRRRERGLRRARAILAAATPWSQSPWESEARRQCLVGGIGAMAPQLPVDAMGVRFYADLGWLTARHILEVDDTMKYRMNSETILQQQGGREDAIRDVGFSISRVAPDELRAPGVLAEHLREALPQSVCETRPVTVLRTRREKRASRP